MSEDVFRGPADTKQPGVYMEITTAYLSMSDSFAHFAGSVLVKHEEHMWDVVQRVRSGEVSLKEYYWVDVSLDEVVSYYKARAKRECNCSHSESNNASD